MGAAIGGKGRCLSNKLSAEDRVRSAVAAVKVTNCKAENAAALQSSNDYAAIQCLPLDWASTILMRKHNVFPNPSSDGFLLDVQRNLRSDLNTRVVVP